MVEKANAIGGLVVRQSSGPLNPSPDLVFAANGDNTAWTNNGAGVFSSTGSSVGSGSSFAIGLGDLNGNGYLDAFVANQNIAPANQVWFNNGSGVFTNSGQSLGSNSSFCVVLIDVNANGSLDAIVGNTVGQANVIWLNDGAGRFFPMPQKLVHQANVGAIRSADVNSNGWTDLVVGVDQSSGSNIQTRIWHNNGIPNIMEYAYNLNPSVADAQVITNLATATNGLPFINVVLSNGAPWFVAETIRLVNPVAISYHLDVAPSLVFTGSVNAAVQTSPLNADYERAIYQAPAPAGAGEAFGRFRVEPEP